MTYEGLRQYLDSLLLLGHLSHEGHEALLARKDLLDVMVHALAKGGRSWRVVASTLALVAAEGVRRWR